jgi:hypothetical protein
VEGMDHLDGHENGSNLLSVQMCDHGKIDLETQGDDEGNSVHKKDIHTKSNIFN